MANQLEPVIHLPKKDAENGGYSVEHYLNLGYVITYEGKTGYTLKYAEPTPYEL